MESYYKGKVISSFLKDNSGCINLKSSSYNLKIYFADKNYFQTNYSYYKGWSFRRDRV